MKSSKLHPTLGLALACWAITFSLAVRAQAQTVSYLADFDGHNGYLPLSSVVQATDGNFYGTTYGNWNYNIGNVYRVTPEGVLTEIYKFCSQPNCPEGNTPSALVLGGDGNLYGVTLYGGSPVGSVYGSGTVFKMTLVRSMHGWPIAERTRRRHRWQLLRHNQPGRSQQRWHALQYQPDRPVQSGVLLLPGSHL